MVGLRDFSSGAFQCGEQCEGTQSRTLAHMHIRTSALYTDLSEIETNCNYMDVLFRSTGMKEVV